VKVLMLLLAIILCSIQPGCNKKAEENQVDFDQINVDNSNDYRYIFKDRIKEEKLQNEKNRKKTFKD
jgi:hypothetical protein